MHEHHHQKVSTANSSEDLNHSQEIAPIVSSDHSTDWAHQLQIWLDLPTNREQRRFLEVHHDLLDVHSETALQDLFAQEPAGTTQMKRRREALQLLQDARRRGGTAEAVREAYIDLYGGLILDLPLWLETVEQQLTELINQNRHEETAKARIELVQTALQKTLRDAPDALEILATLQRELADALWRHPNANHAHVLETSINLCEEALRFYTVIRYPYQYAKTQNNLGVVYGQRIAGEQRENLERAIVCFQEALHVHTLDDFPFEYASAQNNLGNAYWVRIAGERQENLERAIVCFQEVLRVHTLNNFPFGYARAQNNLGNAYWYRTGRKRRESLERAIICFQEALRVYTLDAFPFGYAIVQNNLGNAYRERIAGERRENLEQAIACYHEALRVWTLDTSPFYYASIQKDLGIAYGERIIGERWENLERAIACFQETFRIFTVEAFPRETRNILLRLAETEAQRGNWKAVQDAYKTAREAEDLMIVLGTGTLGRDAILKEGRDAALRQGYALHRLERINDAIAALERGRARGLAEAMAFDAADPTLITDEARRARYTNVRAALVTAQADLHAPLPQDLDENTRRRIDLERTATYRQTKATFDKLVMEIRAANDPEEFLNDALEVPLILQVATHIVRGHALVYLVATPWGGVAVAAFGEQESSSTRFASLDLPDLTEAFVNTLIEVSLDDRSEKLLGGFALAQIGDGFAQICQQWEGETFQAKAEVLHLMCHARQQSSTLDSAAQAAMACPPFASLAEQPLASLNREDYTLLEATFNASFLQQELNHCLKQLGTPLLSSVISWVQKQGATSLTLIPCGQLATFPLAAVLLPDGRSVGETLPTSFAPSARSLLHAPTSRSPQAGMATLGDPHGNLGWSEAEALALSTLARREALPVEVHLKNQATREHLLVALDRRWIVNACCHGTFDAENFLQSALLLANKGCITMAEMLNHHADLRGLRLLMLSACQTAQLDLHGAQNEAHSLAAAMLQAGAQAVVAAQWAVDDKATYLLMVRFMQEWLPQMEYEAPAAALARAQAWLRCVTNQELAHWQSTLPTPPRRVLMTRSLEQNTTRSWQCVPVRGRSARWKEDEAQLIIRYGAQIEEPFAQPYTDPYYWAGFQVIGW